MLLSDIKPIFSIRPQKGKTKKWEGEGAWEKNKPESEKGKEGGKKQLKQRTKIPNI